MADNKSTLELKLQVKDDGSVVIDTVRKKIDEMEKSTVSGGSSIAGALGSIKTGYLAVAAGAAVTVGAVKEFLNSAAEAEEIESRMAFQLEQVGYQFSAIRPLIDDFAGSIQKTTRFSDEMARQGLGQMMQYTTDAEQAMRGVRLAMDMSTQSGQDLGSTTRLVGMAMNGNAEILGRWIPELRDLDSKLGSNATAAEKAAYALDVMNKKFGGASQADIQSYRGKVAQLANQWDDLKESIGRALMPLAQFALSRSQMALRVLSPTEITEERLAQEMGVESETKRKAREQAALAAKIKAYNDDLAQWKATQEQRQALNFQFAMEEWRLKKDTMALIDAEEFMAIEKAKKVGADLNQIRQIFHLKRLEQIRKEKEEEQNAMLSLASMWKGYYDERINRENQVIQTVKGLGVDTTVGARFEFAGIEEQFRKIAEKASMFTEEEFEKIKFAYIEKLKEISRFEGGRWEEIISPVGKEMGPQGMRTAWGTDWRWKEGMMTEEQRRIEGMREESTKRIESMRSGAYLGTPSDIIANFDETRNKAFELQQTIENLKNQKLQIDTSRLIDAMRDIDQVESKLIDLMRGDWKIRVGIEIVGDELINRIESALSTRWQNKRSPLRKTIEDGLESHTND